VIERILWRFVVAISEVEFWLAGVRGRLHSILHDLRRRA
jgi:hypothetical protein